MQIKLKAILKLTHAPKYKAIKFKFPCDYNKNMNRIMFAITILNKYLTIAINVGLIN